MAQPKDGSSEFLKEIEELLQETSTGEEKTTEDNELNESGSQNLDHDLDSSLNESEDIGTKMNISNAAAIRTALTNNEDLEVLRDLCSNGIPDEVRVDVWRAVLGVRRRPDAIGSWTGPLDCDNQTLIHQDSLTQAARLVQSEEEQQPLATTIEEVVTFYCKSRNMSYNEESGWIELLAPLVALGFSKADLFNCLYMLLAKYIPRDCRAGGRPFDLFRLLLLYHDPELCSMLDTRKLFPHFYLQPWLRSLFSKQCSLKVVHTLWDLYLLERDPFLIFFLALVMVINAKELVMETPVSVSVEELNSMILDLPQQLTSDDIADLFSLAQYYAVRTPQSFRKDYHSMLFGSSRTLSSVSPGVLCLPVHMQEVIDSVSSQRPGLKYFLIDCRPLQQFSAGHIPEAMHLDTDLLLHSPQDFSTTMERLCERVRQNGGEVGEHLCFLGSGREQEDQYMNMAIAKFLQQSVPYISVARGGFLELWRILGPRAEQVLEDFDVELCQSLYQDWQPFSNPSPSDNSDSDSESHLTAVYKQRLQAKGAQLYASLATGWRDRSQRLRVRLGQLWQYRQEAAYRDRPLRAEEKKSGKRYRNLPDNVFVIADDDEGGESSEFSTEDDTSNPLVNISLYSTSPEIVHSFPCTEVTESERMFPSHLLLTSQELVVLREAPDRAGWGRVKHREVLNSILKITAKKHHPDIITFKYGYISNGESILTHQLRLRVPNTRRATEAIKEHILKVTKT